jgi:hypothetical protein
MCGTVSGEKQELFYDSRFTANKFVLTTRPLRLTTSNFIFHLNNCGYSPNITTSMTRDGSVVYNCYWSSTVQSFSGPSPAGLMTILSQIRESPNLENQVPVFISPRKKTAQLYPQGTGFHFLHLLRPAGLRWRYWNLPPHEINRNMSCRLVISSYLRYPIKLIYCGITMKI